LTALRETDPRNRAVLEKLALLHRLREDWGKARELCEEILRVDPGHLQTRTNLAFALVKLGDREGARRAYGDAIEADPEDSTLWERLGSLLSEDGLHEKAILAFARAVELAPDDPELRFGFARTWEDSGNAAAALAEYDEALKRDPYFAKAVNGKALLLSHSGRPREAVRVLRSGLPALGDHVETLNNLAWILANESIDPEEGYAHAKNAAALAPDDPAILDTLGWAAIRTGRFREAVAPLERAWEATGDPEVRAHLGIALAESGRVEEGVAHVRAATADRASLSDLPEVARWNRSR